MNSPSEEPKLAAQRHLIVRLRNWVGDVVLGVPALRLLEEHGYTLHLVGRGWAQTLLAGHGWDVHSRPGTLGERISQLRHLRTQCVHDDPGFAHRENALVFPYSFSSALEMRLAGLKAVGYRREARGWLLSRSPGLPVGVHVLESYWSLACHFLGIERSAPATVELAVSAIKAAEADALLMQHGVRPGYVVICPFAGGTFEKLDKTWPNFPDYARHLQALGRTVVACPGPGEDDIIRTQYPGTTLLPKVDLGIYAAILQRAALVVSNDTGPAHMAAAVGAKLISVLGPTKAWLWAPKGPQVTVVQGYPEWPSTQAVLKQTLELLG